MLELHTFTFNAFAEQTYLVDHGNGDCTLIDPGMSHPNERELIANFCDSRGLIPTQLLLTHAHLDHVLGTAFVHEKWGLLPRLHALDEVTYEQAERSAAVYGVPMDPLPELGERLSAGERVMCGEVALEVRLTPGHAPGHVIFVCDAARWVIGGDVLFQGSIGRTDLPGSHAPDLVKSIVEELYTLPDDFEVWPGHGPSTCVGVERESNPFVNSRGSGMLQRGTV